MKSLANYFSLVGIVFVIVFSPSSNAIFIDSSVTATISHQLNDKNIEFNFGPQASLGNKPDGNVVPEMYTQGGSGRIYSFMWTDESGRDFISSNAGNGWVSLETYGKLNEFKSYSFRNQVDVTRRTVITNDSLNDVGLKFDYLINEGNVGYNSASLNPDEYLAASATTNLILNGNNYLWSSGAVAVAGKRYENFFPFSTVGTDMGGTVYSWTNETTTAFNYQWDAQQHSFDFGVLKSGESIVLEQHYRTRVTGNITHCNPSLDGVIELMSCLGVVAQSAIGFGGEQKSPLDIKTYSVPEAPSIYLLLLGALGILLGRVRKK